MRSAIVDAASLTPERLTIILNEHGYLHTGYVVTLQTLQVFESPTAIVYRMAVGYSSDAYPHTPASFILKCFKPSARLGIGLKEVMFYTTLAGPSLPIVHCVDAFQDSLGHGTYCLLEDMTATHTVGVLVSDASYSQLLALVLSLAHLHATFWSHRSFLDRYLAETIASFEDDFTYHEQRYNELLSSFGSQVVGAWREMYHLFLQHAQKVLLERLNNYQLLTLTHSDPHLGNVLFPNRPADPVYLIDFAFHRPWWGARDIAFALTFSTSPQKRRQFEQDLLRRYHGRLSQLGVTGYSWDMCWEDYRLGAITNLRSPLGNRKQPYAWYRLERATQACIDLNCTELLMKQ